MRRTILHGTSASKALHRSLSLHQQHQRLLPMSALMMTSRDYHMTVQRENMLYVGVAVVVAATTANVLYNLYNSSQADAAKPVEGASEKEAIGNQENTTKAQATSTNASSSTASASSSSSSSSSTSSNESSGTTTESPGFLSRWFSRTFYEGGFEEKMSRREAALILGVRESATVERIKDSHRKILLLNHPDRGGSAFIAAKVNEAKDLLMKGK